MSAENIARFTAAAGSNPDLAARLGAIHVAAGRAHAEKIAALSTEVGTPFTAEDFLEDLSQSPRELSDEQLETVAGGLWRASPENVALSIFTFGMACATLGFASAVLSNADACEIPHPER